MKSGFKLTVLLALMAGLLSVSIGWHFFGRAGNKPVPENPSRVMHSNGQTIVVMGADEQKNDGIELQKVKPFDHRITRSAYAVVLDILPILDMRGRYSVACAQLKTDESAEEASRQEFLRLKVLYRDHGNVSLKVLQTAQALWRGDHARLDADQATVRNLMLNVRQEWGETIAHWIGRPSSPILKKMMERREVLIRVALPEEASTVNPPDAITVTPGGGYSMRETAWLISASPRSDPTLLGPVFFYHAQSKAFTTGMRLLAFLPSGKTPVSGVFLPQKSLIWYGGQPWAYVMAGADRFVRRRIDRPEEVPGGWFVFRGFLPNESIVVSGAQLLLSEELIPEAPSGSESAKEEDDDD